MELIIDHNFTTDTEAIQEIITYLSGIDDEDLNNSIAIDNEHIIHVRGWECPLPIMTLHHYLCDCDLSKSNNTGVFEDRLSKTDQKQWLAPAERELLAHIINSFDKMANEAEERIKQYISMQFNNSDLFKAEDVPIDDFYENIQTKMRSTQFKPLTHEQIQYIENIIIDYRDAFNYSMMGIELNPVRVNQLQMAGLIDVGIELTDFYKDSYIFGKLFDVLHRGVDYTHMKQLAAQSPLSISELLSIGWNKQRGAERIVGLGNDVATELKLATINMNRQIIREMTGEAITRRLTWNEYMVQMRRHFKDYARDYHRIAYTEMTNAKMQGIGDSIERKWGSDELVAKIPRPDACKWCKLFYLNPDGSIRVFKLSELRSYGDNTEPSTNPEDEGYRNRLASKAKLLGNGKFRNDGIAWTPTLGTTHPFCRCMLVQWVDPKIELTKIKERFNGSPGMQQQYKKLLEKSIKKTMFTEA